MHLQNNEEVLIFLATKSYNMFVCFFRVQIALWPILNYFVQKLFLRSVLALNQQKTLSMARMILSYLQIFANFKFQHDFQPIFALKLVRIKKLLFLAKHQGHFSQDIFWKNDIFPMHYELFLYRFLILPIFDQILE